ncbi:MAG: NUDIX hydrolase [Pseudomonadota bacterium]
MIPRIGQPPRHDKRYRLRAGAYGILPIGNHFLLTGQYMRTPQEDIQLPGGGIDPGETPLRALHREILEETGWRIAHPRRLGAFRRFVFMPEYNLWAEKLCHVYIARPAYQVADPIEVDHQSLVLPAQEAVAAIGNDGDRLFLRRFLKRRERLFNRRR